VAQIIPKLAIAVGHDTSQYARHSLRAGLVTEATIVRVHPGSY
jgi:hypothetical protein